eukprot:Gb_23654 [translate_table: standard]
MEEDTDRFQCLRLPIGTRKLMANHWTPLLEKFQQKLDQLTDRFSDNNQGVSFSSMAHSLISPRARWIRTKNFGYLEHNNGGEKSLEFGSKTGSSVEKNYQKQMLSSSHRRLFQRIHEMVYMASRKLELMGNKAQYLCDLGPSHDFHKPTDQELLGFWGNQPLEVPMEHVLKDVKEYPPYELQVIDKDEVKNNVLKPGPWNPHAPVVEENTTIVDDGRWEYQVLKPDTKETSNQAPIMGKSLNQRSDYWNNIM